MAGALDVVEKITKLLKWFPDRYPAFWRWLLPDPPQSTIAPEDDERSTKMRNVDYWRTTWQWAGLVPLAYVFLIGNTFLPWSLIGFCMLILSITGLLARYFPIRSGPWGPSSWRQSICGTIWIWAVLLIPTISWAVTDFLDLAHFFENGRPSPPFPRPRLFPYLSICILFSVGNCVAVRWLPQAKA
jgi:hypothetical protein